MPIPILVLAVMAAAKAIVAKTAIAKTIAVAAKGTAVVTKAAAGHGAAVARTASVATKMYGATTVISVTAVALISVGAAAIIIEKAKRVKREIEDGNTEGALVAAASFLSELKGVGGLDDVRSTLNDFISSSGALHAPDVVEKTAALLTALETRIEGI